MGRYVDCWSTPVGLANGLHLGVAANGVRIGAWISAGGSLSKEKRDVWCRRCLGRWGPGFRASSGAVVVDVDHAAG